MDVVTLGMANAAAQRRRTETSAPNTVGQRIPFGRMGVYNNSSLNGGPGVSTFQLTLELQAHFDAVRLIFGNTQTRLSDNTVLCKVASLPDRSDLNGGSASWATVTKNNLQRIATRVAPGNNRIGYTLSDWIALPSVARTDGKTKPILVARAYFSANQNLPVAGNGSDDFTNWASRTDGRFVAMRAQAGDCVTTPSSFTSTVNISQCPIIGVQYLSRGRVVNVMVAGDSTDEGRAGYLGEGFGLPAVEAVTSDALTVEYSNCAWSGQPMSMFAERAVDILQSELRPDVLVFPSGSPNDEPVTLTAAGIAATKARRARVLLECLRVGTKPILRTMMPVNSAVNPWGASDSLRVADNADVVAMAGRSVLVADFASVVAGATSSGQVQLAAGMAIDGIHPSVVANGLLRDLLVPLLRRALGNTASPVVEREPARFIFTATNMHITESGQWTFAGTTAGTATMPVRDPAPASGQTRRSDTGTYRIAVLPTAQPLTLTRASADQFLENGVAVASIVLQPGEWADIINDGGYWRAQRGGTAIVTRSAGYCFELCQQTTGNAALTGFHLRRPFRLGIKPTRFRVRIRNRVQLSDSSPTGEAGKLYGLTMVIGKPAVDTTTGDMNGNWSAAPTEIYPATDLAAGAEAVSGWVDASTFPLDVDVLNMLGYSFTSGNDSASQVALSGGFSFRDSTPANLKTVAPATALTRSDNASFLQVIVEYEHTDVHARHLLVVGNSLSGPSANGSAAPSNMTNVGEMGTWHQIWAQMNRCAASSIAVAGSYSAHFLAGNSRWDLFDGFNIPYVPDMVLYFAAASSDIADCTSASTSNDVKTNIRNVVRRGRAKFANTLRHWWTNVPPRSNFTGSNATATTNEYWRTDLNSWFHNSLPITISGVVDVDEVLTDWANPARLRAPYTTEGVHFTVRAHQNCAEKVPLRRGA